jgi:hypothetical protein
VEKCTSIFSRTGFDMEARVDEIHKKNLAVTARGHKKGTMDFWMPCRAEKGAN